MTVVGDVHVIVELDIVVDPGRGQCSLTHRRCAADLDPVSDDHSAEVKESVRYTLCVPLVAESGLADHRARLDPAVIADHNVIGDAHEGLDTCTCPDRDIVSDRHVFGDRRSDVDVGGACRAGKSRIGIEEVERACEIESRGLGDQRGRRTHIAGPDHAGTVPHLWQPRTGAEHQRAVGRLVERRNEPDFPVRANQFDTEIVGESRGQYWGPKARAHIRDITGAARWLDSVGWVPQAYIHPSAEIDDGATIGDGASVWQQVHIRSGARVGEDCVIGRGVYVGPGVVVGRRSKIQNAALVYDPARIGEGVFIGPAVVLTNDRNPRSVSPTGELKRGDDWDASGVTIGDGAAIGANSTVLAGVTIGKWALVGAGSVVIRDVPAHALVVGNPARQVGWVGRAGVRLRDATDGTLVCDATGEIYRRTADGISLVDD